MKLLTLTGPSCSGKTTMLNDLVNRHGFKPLISHTTREPRPGEIDGKDYFFVSENEFRDLYDAGKFIESVRFIGKSYGISVDQLSSVTNSGNNPVLIVEPNGLHQVSAYCKSHSIELTAAYVGGDAAELMSRYLYRSNHFDFCNKEECDNHAKRLYNIIKESSDWPNAFPYNMYFKQSTPESLVGDVDGLAHIYKVV